MNYSKSLFSLVIVCFILSLSGCGGGGDGGGDTPPGGGDPSIPQGDKDNPVLWNAASSSSHNNNIVIDESFAKYFKITNLTSGQDLKLNLSSSFSVKLTVYEFADYTSSTCTTNDCIIAGNSSGEAYIKVAWSGISGTTLTYTYSMNLSSNNFEGSILAPIDLTGLTPYSKTIGADLSGYYYLTGLTAGNRYTFALVLPTGSDSDLYVYQDAFSSQACSSTYTTNGSDESCSFTAASTTAWIKIRANEGGAFDFTVADNGVGTSYTSVGSVGSEVEVSLDTVSGTSGSVDYTASYYHIAGLDPAKQYRVATWVTSRPEDNIDLYVYGDSAYSNLLCSGTNVRADVSEVCVNAPSAGGELWIKVDGSTAHQELGAFYYLYVNTFYPNEGSSSAPIQLSFGSGTPLHSGTVDANSYYKINGLTAGLSYVVQLNNFTNNLTDVFVDAASASAIFPDCEAPSWDFSATDIYCIAEAGSTGSLYVKVRHYYSTGDFKGSSFDLSVSLSTHQSEGTIDAPIARAFGSADLPYSTTVGGEPSYYVVSGLTIGEAYTISTDGAPNNTLRVYSSDPSLPSPGVACYGASVYGSSIAQCTTLIATDTVWIKVTDSNLGAAFTLDVIYSPYQAQGSLATPIQIAFGADDKAGVTHNGTVSIDTSYYQLNGLTAGKTYAIAVRNINATYNHSLYVFDDETLFASTSSADTVCYLGNISSNFDDRYCFVTATGSTLWIKLEAGAASNGGSFELTARVKPLLENIALDYSVPMTFPYEGSVGTSTNSTYTISGLGTNELYEVTLSNLTDDVDISGCPTTQNSGLSSEFCIMEADASGNMTVSVRTTNTLYGAYFNLGLTTGNINEGTSAIPLPIALVGLPYSGQVGTGKSYYKITGLLADTLYEVNLTQLSAAAVLRVYTENFAISQCNTPIVTSADQLCGGTSTATGELFIVADSRALGVNYNLNVVQGVGQEGAPTAEIALVYGSSDLPHAGIVDKSSSYYEISNLDGATNYYVVLTNFTSTPTIRVHQDNTYGALECSAGKNGTVVACVGKTKNGGGGGVSLFVEVGGIGTLIGSSYTLDILTTPSTEGTLLVPSTLDFATVNATPYEGQVGTPAGGEVFSYYRLDNLTDETSYALSLVTHQAKARLYIYTSAADLDSDTYSCLAFTSSVGIPQVCNVSSVGTSLWIKIGNYYDSTNDGTFFTLSVTP